MENERVLLVAPMGQDAKAMAVLLSDEGLRSEVCEGLAECAQQIEEGAGALVLTEEALEAPRFGLLLQALEAQPPWSELPIIILTNGGESRLHALLNSVAASARGVTVLERPMSRATFLRSVQVALQSRRRQYEIRDLLEAKHRSEERLRLIIENAREYAILALNLERRITSWNPGAEAILGYSQAEIIGESADVIFTADDIAQGAPVREAEAALRDGRAFDERWHLRKDGSRFWASGAMMRKRNREGEAVGFVKIFRDTTRERETNLALEESREQLRAALNEAELARAEAERASRAKDEFLAVLSHELRTPLTPVILVTEMLARRQDLSEEVREALAMIRRNIRLEAHFVDDLLDVTRIGRGKMELHREPMQMHDAIRRAVEVTQSELDSKQQRLTVALEAADHSLKGDFSRLQQVIWNLLKNASKFTPAGGDISIRTSNEAGRLVVEVADTGIGIEAQALPVIFDAFTQADRTIARRFGGLGLGLAIAKATVVAHGGELLVESAGEGQGATFTVALPRK